MSQFTTTHFFNRVGFMILIQQMGIKHFEVHQIPKLTKGEILVTDTDSTDFSTGIGAWPKDWNHTVNTVGHWFATNVITKHPKITPIPIGIDYHTIARRNNIEPIVQESELLSIRSNMKHFSERKQKIVFNFGWINSYRAEALNGIQQNLINKIDRIPRHELLKIYTDYAFVASPHGNGLDCHRTWEALILGCIPIVKTSPIDDLYDGLPVLIVENWSDINAKLLSDTIIKFNNTNFNYDKLTLKYYVDLVKQKNVSSYY